MAQKFPEIGLRAVFEITGFMSGYRKYQTVMRDVDKITKQTAQKVTESGKDLGRGFARNIGELTDQSRALQQAFSDVAQGGSNIIQSLAQLEAGFDSLGRQGAVNVEVFDRLVSAGLSMGDAFNAASGRINFSISTFDKLIQKGVDVEKAFEQASQGAADASGSITLMGRSFTTAAVAIGAVTVAIKASIALVRRSIDEYTELAEATRRLHYQTGILTREASGWVQVLQASGSTAATSGRAMTSFLSKIEDMRREQRLGEESTSDFSKALKTLQVSLEDDEGNLKSTEQLLTDVNKAFQALGPGAKSTQAAMDLFGYGGRQLLPILTDQKVSLAEYMNILDRFGARMTALDREEYEAFRRSNFELRAALQGVYNHIATQWIPVLTQVQRVVANVISIYRQFVRAGFDLGGAQKSLVDRLSSVADALEKLNDKVDVVVTNYRILMMILNPARAAVYAMRVAMGESAQTAEQLAQAEEEMARTRAQVAAVTADAIEAEEKLRKERQETLEQLDDLKSQLTQKLGDIDRDAQQGWDDILVNRQREAMDRALQLAWRLDDLRSAYNDRLDAIEQDFARRWDDILVKRQREAIERAIRLAWRYEDLARATEQRRQDVLRDYADREAEQRRETLKRIQDAEEDARQRREKLERDHQERLIQIRLDFLDTAQEAARRNDAVAVARAMRERARAIRDEERRYGNEQRDLAESLARKRQDIERDRQEREADHRRELARALQRIEENHQRQVEELERQRDRERIIRELHYQWELEDFEKAKAEQKQAARDAYDKQIAELEKAQKREEILRQRQYERQEIDFVRNWQRRIADARRWYQREREELAQHLNMTAQQLEHAYAVWMQQAATAAQQAARVIAAAWASEITRYQHYLPRPGATGRPGVAAPTLGMAEGGVVHATSPTTIVMGEAGPETAVFMPGRSGSLNVNHNFGRLGVDFQGLPGGVNTQQVQAIVYSVMTQLAKGIQIPRG